MGTIPIVAIISKGSVSFITAPSLEAIAAERLNLEFLYNALDNLHTLFCRGAVRPVTYSYEIINLLP